MQFDWAVVVAQLVEWSLPTTEIRGSNSGIGNFIVHQLHGKDCIEKTEINKRGREWPNLKNAV